MSLDYKVYCEFKNMASFEEASFLWDQASLGGNILEVGTGPGTSALLMAKALTDFEREGVVSTIGWEQEAHWAYRAIRKINSYPLLAGRINHTGKKSEEVHQNYKDGDFNFVYIDGDHSYEGVKKDIANYKSKVSQSGMLAFHDTDKEEVAKAIAEGLKGWKLVAQVDRIKGYIRDQSLTSK